MKNLTILTLLILASSCGTINSHVGISLDPQSLTASLVQKKLAEAEAAGAMATAAHDERGAQCFADGATWLRAYPAYEAPIDCGFCQLEHLRLVRLWLSSPAHENADVSCRTFLTDKGSLLGWLLHH